jgi:uncharacterized coiled-coil protein SlyX
MESKKRENYIEELEHKIKELEKKFKKQENYIKELKNKIKELETSQTDSAPREPHRSLTGTSEMADLRTGESSPTKDDHSVILKSLRNKILATPTGASEAESDILQESLLASPEEQELPEFNTVEDLSEWLGLSMDDTTPSEAESDILTSEEEDKLLASPEEVGSPEEEMELLESEIPEFNWTEDLRQWLEL